MKYDTHSLTGARLARAVLECLMLSGTWQLDRPLPQAQGYVFLSPEDQAAWRPFRPDEVWAHGGPIIDAYDITVKHVGGGNWYAYAADTPVWENSEGTTALEAAMRAFIYAIAGESIDIPEEQ